MMFSMDTEATGIDIRHGAKPFIVTTCNEEQEQSYWEWDVNPLTREPVIPKGDIEEIRDFWHSGPVTAVFQNPKYDVGILNNIGLWDELELAEVWKNIGDTLNAGHILASNQPHDLTSMALVYLGVNIKPLEDAVQLAANEARRIIRSKLPDWRIAKEGLPEMPSAKNGSKRDKKGVESESPWKFDMWTPKALIKHAIYNLQFDLIPPSADLPVVVDLNKATYDVRIDRASKWGNPFVIGKDGNRNTVIKKYAKWIWEGKGQHLLNDLDELKGKRLGCHCAPSLCHGDVLRLLCHPWMRVAINYANGDSAVTLPLYKRQLELIKERGLEKIFQVRLDLLPVVYKMESGGVTLSKSRKDELTERFTEESESAGRVCMNLSEGLLEKPPLTTTNALREVVFNKFGLVPCKQTNKGNDSMDKVVIEDWLATLPPKSKQYTFVKNMRVCRRRGTALGYMKTYEKFWLPLVGDFYKIYPSINQTGTDTLRMASYNPNEQQISKQEDGNLRYVFGPAPGREWWSCDAQNIELRLPAYEAGETAMIELFERPNDPPYFGSNHLLFFDILHPDKWDRDDPEGLLKAKKKYNSTWYQWTKNGDFAVQYGAVAESGTADRAYHVPGGQAKIESRLTNIKRLSQAQIRFAQDHGYVETIPDKTVDPLHGYPLLCTRSKWGKILPTVPLSYHIQGSAMWWMTKAMIRCREYLDDLNSGRIKAPLVGDYLMVMQIHDELVFDFPKGNGLEPWKTNLPVMRKIRQLMAKGGDDYNIPTPVGCEYHAVSWAEGKTINTELVA